jgi:hypothetical protein
MRRLFVRRTSPTRPPIATRRTVRAVAAPERRIEIAKKAADKRWNQ